MSRKQLNFVYNVRKVHLFKTEIYCERSALQNVYYDRLFQRLTLFLSTCRHITGACILLIFHT